MIEIDRRPAAGPAHRRRSGCSRCCATCSRTPSSSPKRAASRSGSVPPRARRCAPAVGLDRAFRHRHRHRHPRGQAAHHLRGLPAGRRHDEPQVRRHRPRPRDQPRDRAASRRRDRGLEPAGPGLDLHAVPAARAAGDERGGVPRPPTPRKATARSCGRSAVGADGAVGLRRRPARHRLRRSRRAHRRGRRDVRVGASRARAREGIQGPDRQRRRDGAGARAPLQAARDHARYRPAGHGRLGAARPAEARSSAPATCRSTSSRSTTRRSAACGPAPSASSRSRSTATR